MMREEFTAVFSAIDQTRKIKDACDLGLLTLPPTPRGNQVLRDGFAVGSKVVATGGGTIKAGITGRVAERWKENGYWYYRVDGMGVQRQQDLRAGK